MFVDQSKVGELTSQERRDGSQDPSRTIGRVIHCDGARATIAATASGKDTDATALWSVGRIISINLGSIRTVGLVHRIEGMAGDWLEDGDNPIRAYVELLGEVSQTGDGAPTFDRGITTYPPIGAVAHRIRAADLQAVYDLSGRLPATIGRLSQDATIDARIAIDDTLNRHFAVVGTTGVGKSSAVALLLRKAIISRPDLRVLILDPHNEFASAFPDHAIRVNTSTLDLPFWLFRLDELVEVLYQGRKPIPEEVDLLRELLPLAKQHYRTPPTSALARRPIDGTMSITADTPIPYRMADVAKLINDRMGLLESKNDRPIYRALRARIETAANDPRYRFMFSSRTIGDNIHETIGTIFRVPLEGRPVTCLELGGLPSEVVNSVCSVVARLAFDVAVNSQGRLKLLVLCEEAHRYMPADPQLGFAPTRHALSRIAKEGRKYGCSLGVVTQRPGELDPTVLSQCSTVFAMRLANEVDQNIIRSAISDSSASSLSFLSSMGQREAIAFGDGVGTTMRLKFEQLPADQLPGAASSNTFCQPTDQDIDIFSLVEALRRAESPAQSGDEAGLDFPSPLRGMGFSSHPVRGTIVPTAPEGGGRRSDDTGLRRLYE